MRTTLADKPNVQSLLLEILWAKKNITNAFTDGEVGGPPDPRLLPTTSYNYLAEAPEIKVTEQSL